MITDFNSIPETSKIWIFPASRKFYAQELPEITTKIDQFLTAWENENQPISASYVIKYDRFIIITADDTQQSLSLEAQDSLATFIQSLENSCEIILMDRINVCYKQGEFVQYKTLPEFKKMIKDKGVSQNTMVFNSMINLKEELEFGFEINIMDSWLGRFVKTGN
ncbi:MAG: ABC transporter ATPase [Lutibacter sp.]|nr:ABC transporter ATPase [Lutibacter sp.]